MSTACVYCGRTPRPEIRLGHDTIIGSSDGDTLYGFSGDDEIAGRIAIQVGDDRVAGIIASLKQSNCSKARRERIAGRRCGIEQDQDEVFDNGLKGRKGRRLRCCTDSEWNEDVRQRIRIEEA